MAPQNGTDPRNIFVIHGRNLAALDEMGKFLRALELHPLEWPELVSSTGLGSPYIGQVLDAAFSEAHAVVVLLTPDDEARLQEPYRQAIDPEFESVLTGQARPNVLFEAGMALGRQPERTILVQLGEIRRFSDIAGRHILDISNTPDWRNQLLVRLESAGCAIDRSRDDWRSAGEFRTALGDSQSPMQDSAEAAVVGKKDPYSPPISGEVQVGGISEQPPVAQPLSADALTLFYEAYASNKSAYIGKRRVGAFLHLYTMNKKYVESPVGGRVAKRWENALTELYEAGLVDDNGSSETFYLTSVGREYLGSLAARQRQGLSSAPR